jgi:hypothetical protein
MPRVLCRAERVVGDAAARITQSSWLRPPLLPLSPTDRLRLIVGFADIELVRLAEAAHAHDRCAALLPCDEAAIAASTHIATVSRAPAIRVGVRLRCADH